MIVILENLEYLFMVNRVVILFQNLGMLRCIILLDGNFKVQTLPFNHSKPMVFVFQKNKTLLNDINIIRLLSFVFIYI